MKKSDSLDRLEGDELDSDDDYTGSTSPARVKKEGKASKEA